MLKLLAETCVQRRCETCFSRRCTVWPGRFRETFRTSVARQVSRKVEPLSTSVTVATIALVTKTRVSPCNTTLTLEQVVLGKDVIVNVPLEFHLQPSPFSFSLLSLSPQAPSFLVQSTWSRCCNAFEVPAMNNTRYQVKLAAIFVSNYDISKVNFSDFQHWQIC